MSLAPASCFATPTHLYPSINLDNYPILEYYTEVKEFMDNQDPPKDCHILALDDGFGIYCSDHVLMGVCRYSAIEEVIKREEGKEGYM